MSEENGSLQRISDAFELFEVTENVVDGVGHAGHVGGRQQTSDGQIAKKREVLFGCRRIGEEGRVWKWDVCVRERE